MESIIRQENVKTRITGRDHKLWTRPSFFQLKYDRFSFCELQLKIKFGRFFGFMYSNLDINSKMSHLMAFKRCCCEWMLLDWNRVAPAELDLSSHFCKKEFLLCAKSSSSYSSKIPHGLLCFYSCPECILPIENAFECGNGKFLWPIVKKITK